MLRGWLLCKIYFMMVVHHLISCWILKQDTSEKMNPTTALKGGCMAARYGGRTASIPSWGLSMDAVYGGNSTSRMVKIKTYKKVYTGKCSVSTGVLLILNLKLHTWKIVFTLQMKRQFKNKLFKTWMSDILKIEILKFETLNFEW